MPHYVARNLRTGRFSEIGRIYLVTTTTRDRRPIFSDWTIGRLVVHQFKFAQECNLVDSLAFVIMPDHLHWLFELRNSSLSSLMRMVKCRSTLAINKRLDQSGPIWQKGFHDRALRRDEDLQAAARYIVANPRRAGLVDRTGNYPLWDAKWL